MALPPDDLFTDVSDLDELRDRLVEVLMTQRVSTTDDSAAVDRWVALFLERHRLLVIADLNVTVRWNADKPHRCPVCHTVAVDLERPRSWVVYTCCRCKVAFTRWPRLSRVLPQVGVRCREHLR